MASGTDHEGETAAENNATIARLDLRSDDSVLEVGFGSGRALETVAEVVTTGRVAGVELSQDMLDTAA